jgi:RNA polymerase sigma-70 factor (ECF subfamily)
MVDDPAATAFQRHYAQVVRYLRRHTGSQEEAEDLAQAVFADAAERLRHLEPGPPPVLAWLYTVAQRRLADRGRRAGRRPETFAALEPVRVDGVEEQRYGRAVAAALREAIEELPPGQRAVVVLKLLEGRPFAEIGRLVGASEAACKMRFARGLEAVRTDLRARGLEP